MIWEFASHDNSRPGIFSLRKSTVNGLLKGTIDIGRLRSLYLQTDTAIKTPVLLHACQESRSLLTKKYTKNFDLKYIYWHCATCGPGICACPVQSKRRDCPMESEYFHYNRRVRGHNCKEIYWNPNRDVVYLSEPTISWATCKTRFDGITTLAIDEYIFMDLFRSGKVKMVMKNLEIMFVICKTLRCSTIPALDDDVEDLARTAQEEKTKDLVHLVQKHFVQAVEVIVVGHIWEVEDLLFSREERRKPHRTHTVKPFLTNGTRQIHWERVDWRRCVDYKLRREMFLPDSYWWLNH